MRKLWKITITAGLIAGVLLAACSPEPTPAPAGPDVEGEAEDNTPAPAAPAEATPLLPTLLPDSELDPDDPLVQDARYFARDANISVEEAYRRLQLQGPIGDMNAQLSENETGTFAGLWIQHEPEYAVVVRFTENGEQTIQPYIEDSEFEGLVEVRGADYTLTELSAMQAEAHDVVDALDIPAESGQNMQENRVELYVTDRSALEDALTDAGETLSEGVTVVEVDALSTPE